MESIKLRMKRRFLHRTPQTPNPKCLGKSLNPKPTPFPRHFGTSQIVIRGIISGRGFLQVRAQTLVASRTPYSEPQKVGIEI